MLWLYISNIKKNNHLKNKNKIEKKNSVEIDDFAAFRITTNIIYSESLNFKTVKNYNFLYRGDSYLGRITLFIK